MRVGGSRSACQSERQSLAVGFAPGVSEVFVPYRAEDLPLELEKILGQQEVRPARPHGLDPELLFDRKIAL
jgi:hypothetical protein